METLESLTELAILKGLDFLEDHQFPNGEFCCYIGDEDTMKMCITQSNIFPSSLIAYSLLQLRHLPVVNQILDRTAAFLQYQTMRAGVWNNFTVLNPLFPICPPDVDNTVCASYVLNALNKDYPSNEQIILANRSKSGLLYTWYTFRKFFVPVKDYWLLCLRELKHPISSFLFWKNTEASRYDIDAVVNANVLFHLGYKEETAAIVPFLLQIIKMEKEADCDLWYRNPFTIYYFFSRIYKAGIKEMESARSAINDRVLKAANADGSFGTGILDTALGLITLINGGHETAILDQAVEFIISKQKKSGGWPRWALYYGGPKKRLCYGSEELTTGFCLEALRLYSIQKQQQNGRI
ncbi:hypothetical protein [Pedobacter gandavensis]|uniref:hypothetical protein n=1 Tax=Pedobacter gandavensis TaxID=2679963 RepID=UPI0029310A36|nr:hypothetical protein [Pedobacter gandavensis]